RFPVIRENLLAAIEILADTDLQQRVWIEGRSRPDVIEDFDVVVNMLLDTAEADRLSEADVGVVVRDVREVRAGRRVGQLVQRLLDTHGVDLTDAAYARTPEWPEIVVAANDALQVFQLESPPGP